MVTTRRSSRGKPSSPLVSRQLDRHQRVLGVQSAGIQPIGQFRENSFYLVHLILVRSTPHLWFRILPVDGQNDDISVATGVEWRHLLPLLTKCGLLRSNETSIVTNFHCNHTSWDEMAKSFSSHFKMEITCIRTSHSHRTYFYCIGKPLYKNPIIQGQVIGSKQVRSRKNPPRMLMNLVRKATENVIVR